MNQMSKIGILTLSASDNCGSLLQTYALKKLLEDISQSSVDVINFSTEQSHRLYDILRLDDLFHHRKRRFVSRMMHYRKLREQKQGYCFFRKKYLEMHVQKEIFPHQLEQACEQYDVIVVGSDQVWNVCMGDFDNAFFAGWSNQKKIAYAPSLGGHDLSESASYNEIKQWLTKFSALSVREVKGQESIQRAIPGCDVPIVLDPTLTVDISVWKDLIGERLVEGPYIFFYSWAYCDDDLNDIVKLDADKMGCDVYVTDASKWCNRDIKRWNFLFVKENGPLAFLNLMYYAEKCYVQSFHGMIFAYLFQRNFWLLDTHENFDEIDARLKELIRLFQAEDRVLTVSNYKETDLNADINYAEKKGFQNEKEKSRNYLRQALKQ